MSKEEFFTIPRQRKPDYLFIVVVFSSVNSFVFDEIKLTTLFTHCDDANNFISDIVTSLRMPAMVTKPLYDHYGSTEQGGIGEGKDDKHNYCSSIFVDTYKTSLSFKKNTGKNP